MAESTNVNTGNVNLPKFLFSTDGGSVFTAIARLMAPSMPETTIASYPTTNTDITDGHETSLAGWANGGTQALEFIHTEAEYAAALALVQVNAQFKTTWEDPAHAATDSSQTYAGHMTAIVENTPLDGTKTFTVTFQVSGKATRAVGT